MCEGKLRKAASEPSQGSQELAQKLQEAEQALRIAHARLKDRDRGSALLEERATTAEAEIKRLAAELAAGSAAAAEAAEKELGSVQAAWESERAALVAAAADAGKADRKRAEQLEGSLAECRGRVAGLEQGCDKCWQMLDEAQAGITTIIL